MKPKYVQRSYPRYRGRRSRFYAAVLAAAALAVAAVLLFRGKKPPAVLPDDGASALTTAADPAAAQSPAVPDATDALWYRILTNPWQPLPANYENSIPLASLPNGKQVDSRCLEALEQMLDDCRSAGLTPVVCSAFRSQQEQQALFDEALADCLASGLSEEQAHQQAAKAVAVPGTSEHQTGLAVDLVDIDNQLLDASQEDTPVQRWLMAHCAEYGFILRYPNQKSALTGIIYEPWHYRYVGKDIAQSIMSQGLCLEEYLR